MKKTMLLLAALVTLIWAGMGDCFSYAAHSSDTKTFSRESMVRLHVVAQSDSEEDQRQKLLVRDAVLRVLEDQMRGAQDRQDAAARIESLLPQIRLAARRALREAGEESADVCARIQTETFPSIAYDGQIVPAGQYTALRVVIGEGAGRNWWCVLFPPLCYADVHMDESLPEEDESQPVQIRWFVREWLENNGWTSKD